MTSLLLPTESSMVAYELAVIALKIPMPVPPPVLPEILVAFINWLVNGDSTISSP